MAARRRGSCMQLRHCACHRRGNAPTTRPPPGHVRHVQHDYRHAAAVWASWVWAAMRCRQSWRRPARLQGGRPSPVPAMCARAMRWRRAATADCHHSWNDAAMVTQAAAPGAGEGTGTRRRGRGGGGGRAVVFVRRPAARCAAGVAASAAHTTASACSRTWASCRAACGRGCCGGGGVPNWPPASSAPCGEAASSGRLQSTPLAARGEGGHLSVHARSARG